MCVKHKIVPEGPGESSPVRSAGKMIQKEMSVPVGTIETLGGLVSRIRIHKHKQPSVVPVRDGSFFF
jgi:hypothetical protein